MPAMKPSTTTRARTSRCDSRATTSGSSARRRSSARARTPAAPWSGWAPEADRGPDGVMSVLPCLDHHFVGVFLERAAIEPTPDLPARKAGGAEEQLHLVAVGPAQVESHPRHGRRTGIAMLQDLALQHHDLAHTIVAGHVVYLDPVAGLGMRGLDREHPAAVLVEDRLQCRVEQGEDEAAAGLEVLAHAAQRVQLVIEGDHVHEHAERGGREGVTTGHREVAHVG